MENIGYIVVIASCLFAIGVVLLVANDDITRKNGQSIMDKDEYYFFPIHVYKRYNLNLFGTALASLWFFVVNYFYCICMTFWWLMHVGRKEK